MGFLACAFLLWQFCCLVSARPQRVTRQVAGVPQYVLDYGKLSIYSVKVMFELGTNISYSANGLS
jgi:hypothetical protein